MIFLACIGINNIWTFIETDCKMNVIWVDVWSGKSEAESAPVFFFI